MQNPDDREATNPGDPATVPTPPEVPAQLWAFRSRNGKLIGNIANGYIGTFVDQADAIRARHLLKDASVEIELIGVHPENRARAERAENEAQRLRGVVFALSDSLGKANRGNLQRIRTIEDLYARVERLNVAESEVDRLTAELAKVTAAGSDQGAGA